MRAVGAANGRNPISIIAPCHRVIGASGELTGFAGGLSAKQMLLEIEGINAANSINTNQKKNILTKKIRVSIDDRQSSLFDE